MIVTSWGSDVGFSSRVDFAPEFYCDFHSGSWTSRVRSCRSVVGEVRLAFEIRRLIVS